MNLKMLLRMNVKRDFLNEKEANWLSEQTVEEKKAKAKTNIQELSSGMNLKSVNETLEDSRNSITSSSIKALKMETDMEKKQSVPKDF